MRQKTIAERCGVSLRTYQDWQAGINVPSEPHLAQLAVLFGVSTSYIISGDAPEVDIRTQLTRVEEYVVDLIVEFKQVTGKSRAFATVHETSHRELQRRESVEERLVAVERELLANGARLEQLEQTSREIARLVQTLALDLAKERLPAASSSGRAARRVASRRAS